MTTLVLLATSRAVRRRARADRRASSTSIPLVGATIGTVIVAAVALDAEGFATAAIVVVGDDRLPAGREPLLQQLVYHRTVKLSPLAIALSVAAGAELGGVPGALLGIPFAGALKVVVRRDRCLAARRGRAARGRRRGGDDVRSGVEMSVSPEATHLPPLPLEEWEATKVTLHLWVQIVGKVRMAWPRPRNHWWHVTLSSTLAG